MKHEIRHEIVITLRYEHDLDPKDLGWYRKALLKNHTFPGKAEPEVEIIATPTALYDPPNPDPEKDSLPDLVCPHCGYKGKEGWEIVEDTTVWRKLEIKNNFFAWGVVADSGEIGGVRYMDCPECHKAVGFPDDFFEWFV